MDVQSAMRSSASSLSNSEPCRPRLDRRCSRVRESGMRYSPSSPQCVSSRCVRPATNRGGGGQIQADGTCGVEAR